MDSFRPTRHKIKERIRDMKTPNWYAGEVQPSVCEHDYESPIRKGRAHLVCRKCGADITLALVLQAEENTNEQKELNGR